MKKRGILLLLALILALGIGVSCGQTERPSVETDYVLYFLNGETALQSGALRPEGYPFEGDGEPKAEELIRALLKGPQSEELKSPFPKGVVFQWCRWDETREGHLRVGLSEQYSGLTDIALTLADYSIVLTLGQLEGVNSVEIVVSGQKAYSRSHQVLTAEEVLLLDSRISG